MCSEFCIETHDLVKTFGDKTAINHLTLAIPNTGIHAIVGSNGAGKSTLFRLLLGVDTPNSGSIKVYGESATNLSPTTRAKVAYVNEEHTLPTWMKVNALLKMQKHFYPKWNDTIYNNVIGFFDVDPNQKIAGLSRGERAGVNLAMVLAQQASTLILDEPTLGLDVVAKQSFLEALLFAERESESTIIYCSHQMEEIERVAENLIILEKGQLTNSSTPEAFVERIKSVMVEAEHLGLSASSLKAEVFEKLPGFINTKSIDESYQLTFVDRTLEQITADLNARSINISFAQNVSLNQAVNAFLSKHHSRPSQAKHTPA